MMIIDVEDSQLNMLLSVCFYMMILLTLFSFIPGKKWGVAGSIASFSPIAIVVLYGIYEYLIPSNYNIRLDLLILYPLILITFIARSILHILAKRPSKS